MAEYQEHSGAVNTSTSVKTQYGYADGANNSVRRTSQTYPNGTVVETAFGLANSLDDRLSRVAAIKYGTTEVAAMAYLGAGTVIQMRYAPAEVAFRLNLGVGLDPYDGLDRFDRVVDLTWRSDSSTDLERMKYGYDRAHNRLWMERLADPNRFHDELYGYDGLYRLANAKRGTLNGGHTAISPLKFAQEWGLDPTGNWGSFKEDGNGDTTWDLVQARVSNRVNQITGITESSGPSCVDPVYTRAGEMTTIPKPADLTIAFAATYDAWARLVLLGESSTQVLANAYDGLNRLIVNEAYISGVLSETRYRYYNGAWQCLEERVGASSDPMRHFVWGIRYIDELLCDIISFNPVPALDRFALVDEQFSVYALAQTAGVVLERVNYAAYGIAAFLSAQFSSNSPSSAYDQRLLFSGYSLDGTSQLYQIRRRQFAPNVGSWLTRDPNTRIDINLYRYCFTRPTSFSDPSGLAGDR